MRYRLWTIFIAMLFSSVVFAQRKRAFLVGISHYDTALTGYQWNNINGVEDVNLLSSPLKKQGFILTTLLDEQATFDNITRQLSLFVDKTKKGDIVYIHFSTHGQPVEDFNGDEEDGWDEAIVPIDAYKIYKKGTYEGKKHLIGEHELIFIPSTRLGKFDTSFDENKNIIFQKNCMLIVGDGDKPKAYRKLLIDWLLEKKKEIKL